MIRLIGGLEMLSNAGKFGGNPSEVKYSDTGLKLGGVFTF